MGLIIYYGVQGNNIDLYTALTMRAIGPAICLTLNLCKVQSNKPEYEMYDYFLGFIYHMSFFNQGLLDLSYKEKQDEVV